MSRVDTQAVLIGRDREVGALAERIDAASGPGGGALLLRGPAGIGKSSLLEAAKAHAAVARFQILTSTGIQSESQLPFAGLHQLLRPVLREVDRLPDSYAHAIRAAFGLSDQTAPSPYLIALSTLHLLGECADAAPVLLLVDDAQWLDLPTAEALAFVARRLESDPIVLLATVRDGFEIPLLGAGIPELRVEGLSDLDARSLLAVRAPGLTAALRDRILGEASGNPLALVELSGVLSATSNADRMLRTAHLPLNDRLELAFADRLSSLTPATRGLLDVASVDPNGILAQLLSAASSLEGREITLEAIAGARSVDLVEIDGEHLRFRHPLMRSAIHQSMSLERRQAVHAAWASTLEADPDRRVWHRAAEVVGPYEEIAAELEAAAARAERRGAVSVALEALERAAQLAGDPARRGSRLIQAVHKARILGRRNDVVRILNSMDDSELGPLEQAQAALLRLMSTGGTWSGAPRILSFAGIAERMRVEGDVEGGLRLLASIAHRCWWANLDEGTRARLIEIAERFPVSENDSRLIHALALVAPVERGAAVLERISRRWAELPDWTGEELDQLSLAALAVGDFARAEQMFDASISHCRGHGLLGDLVSGLAMQAWTKIHRGDWVQAASMADEAARLSDEVGQRIWRTKADLASATIAAYRGDVASSDRLSSAGEQALLPRDANPHLALVQYPRGAAALADGRYDEAYQHLRRIFEPSDTAYHPHVRSWALIDLVDAALHSRHEDEAGVFVRELDEVASQTGWPFLLASLEFAHALLTPEPNEETFQASLAGLVRWPFPRARLQLAYGLWLRRQRRSSDARAPLREARDTFDALGATPWGDRARKELRASGETSRRRVHDVADALSPQELQIAQLAASGLSNKEIGQQLFLSHRTVGSHLYRIFPKLGITARSHLRAALQAQS
jgi:DNA-binding CsgD family transcriptional regulator